MGSARRRQIMSERRQGGTPDKPMSGAPDMGRLSAREAAVALGLHERTIRRAIARGDLAAAKHAGVFRIHRDDLAIYLGKSKRTAFLAEPFRQSPHLVSLPGGREHAAFLLPRQLTPLVGRAEEIETVHALLSRPDVSL